VRAGTGRIVRSNKLKPRNHKVLDTGLTINDIEKKYKVKRSTLVSRLSRGVTPPELYLPGISPSTKNRQTSELTGLKYYVGNACGVCGETAKLVTSRNCRFAHLHPNQLKTKY
jgi:hypothetical protein